MITGTTLFWMLWAMAWVAGSRQKSDTLCVKLLMPFFRSKRPLQPFMPEVEGVWRGRKRVYLFPED